jgi:hypothetical protein
MTNEKVGRDAAAAGWTHQTMQHYRNLHALHACRLHNGIRQRREMNRQLAMQLSIARDPVRPETWATLQTILEPGADQ